MRTCNVLFSTTKYSMNLNLKADIVRTAPPDQSLSVKSNCEYH